MQLGNSNETQVVTVEAERGAATLEMSISGPLLFFLLLIIADFGRVAYTFVGAQFALSSTARWLSLGEHGSTETREQAAARYFAEKLKTFGVQPSEAPLYLCPMTLAPCTRSSAGYSGETISLEAELFVRSFILNYRIPMKFEASVTNEPF